MPHRVAPRRRANNCNFSAQDSGSALPVLSSKGAFASGGGPSFLVIEAGLTLISMATAFCWPGLGSSWFSKAERFFGTLSRRRGLSVLTVGLTAVVVRLLMLPVVPIPQPFIHDEFSYLLAADTFASGKITNPTHPMWIYFESFHITWKPTYTSMYFPGQGLTLAAGTALLGHPWYGVLASAALMCAAICWTLQGWLPPGWALLGGMLAVIRLALFSYWINSYYGGTVAAIGGALVFGALPRIRRTSKARDFLLLALGAVILANSRPAEGLIVCVSASVSLLWGARASRWPGLRIVLWRFTPSAAMLLTAAAVMGYYNHRAFGDALTLPYQVNRAAYAMAPLFLWQQARPEPLYRYAVMRDFYINGELADFQSNRSLGGFLRRSAKKVGVMMCFFFGTILMIPFIMIWRVLHDRRVRFLIVTGILSWLGLLANYGYFAHYTAPFTAGLYVILMQAMRHLRMWHPGEQPAGAYLVRILPVLCLGLAALRLCAGPLHLAVERWPTMWYGTDGLGMARANVLAKLETYRGKQLVLVRYSHEHMAVDDWVYNAADIDNARVVWAREPDSRIPPSDLLHYFADRTVWLVQPDSVPPVIVPYVIRPALIPDALNPVHYP